MKPRRRSRLALLLPALLLGFLVSAPSPARADAVDTLADILGKIEDATGGVEWLPVTSSQIRESRGLIQCLENAGGDDVAIALCIQEFKDTGVGQSIVGGIPSWVFDLLDLYIAVREEDYWGIIAKVGEAAICIVAQFLAGGSDVCAFVEELIALGEAAVDALVWAGKFLASVGEAAWDAITDAACDVAGIGCEEKPPPPPELLAYVWVFAPKVAEGLAARKAPNELAFLGVQRNLEAQARANPAQLNVTLPIGTPRVVFPEAAVRTASSMFVGAVDAQWSADMVNSVLPARTEKRVAYASRDGVAAAAELALAAYRQSGLSPAGELVRRCDDDFNRAFGFAHVDRWILANLQQAATLHADRNRDWCVTGFVEKNRDLFAERFRPEVALGVCMGPGGTILCASEEAYRKCLEVLGGLIGHGEECRVDAAKVGLEAARAVKAELQNRGSNQSLHPCQIVPSTGQDDPVDLVCPRPTQGGYCEEIYREKYPGFPSRLLDCRVNRPADYAALESKVASEAARLAKRHGVALRVEKEGDPLIVHVPDLASLNKIKPHISNLGFGPPSASPGFRTLFTLARTVDGESTPVLLTEMDRAGGPESVSRSRAERAIAERIPGDPVLSPQARFEQVVTPQAAMRDQMLPAKEGLAIPDRIGGVQATGIPGVTVPVAKRPGEAAGATKPMIGSAPSPPPPATPPAGPGGAAGVPPLQSKPRLPTGPGEVAVTKPGAAADLPLRKALPDLTVTERRTVGGVSVKWGGNLTLNAKDALRAEKGLCQFPVEIAVRNAGAAASGAFKTTLSAGAGPGSWEVSWAGLAAGAAKTEKGAVGLPTGVSTLVLTIDQEDAVQEANEKNNRFTVQTTVAGDCEPRGVRAPAPAIAPTRRQ